MTDVSLFDLPSFESSPFLPPYNRSLPFFIFLPYSVLDLQPGVFHASTLLPVSHPLFHLETALLCCSGWSCNPPASVFWVAQASALDLCSFFASLLSTWDLCVCIYIITPSHSHWHFVQAPFQLKYEKEIAIICQIFLIWKSEERKISLPPTSHHRKKLSESLKGESRTPRSPSTNTAIISITVFKCRSFQPRQDLLWIY